LERPLAWRALETSSPTPPELAHFQFDPCKRHRRAVRIDIFDWCSGDSPQNGDVKDGPKTNMMVVSVMDRGILVKWVGPK